MATGASHVFPEIIDLLNADAAIWLLAVHEERWVTYPRAKSALQRIG